MTKGKYQWSIHRPGDDPELDEIVSRRFGSRHDKPCHKPTVLTCTMPACQYANRCQAHESNPDLH